MENDYYDAKETMSVKERELYLNKRLKDTVAYAYQNAPAFKEKMDRASVTPDQINTVKDLEKIPITRKDDFSEYQKANPPLGGFLAVPKPKTIFVSPGPIYEPEDYDEQFEICAKALYATGFRPGDIAIITFSFHMVPAGIRMAETLTRLGITWVPMGVGNTEIQLEVLRDLKVTCYVGTPSFLGLIIKRAEELGYDFRRDFHLKHAWFIAEMLSPSLRQSFEQDYGLSVAQGYGTAEHGTLAYECLQKSGMHIPEELIVEIVDPQTGRQLGPGEVGEVIVTPFNEIFPLIRYGTGDLSSYITEPCPCGRTSYRLTGVLGRVGEEVKARGMFIHPRQLQEVMSRFDQISRFQVVVSLHDNADVITINIELKDDTIDKKQLSSSLMKDFQNLCRVRPDKVEIIARGTIPEGSKAILDQRVWK
ncbi:MAG: AMP-binding protein [Chloroflexi bacterium]|nr:AMP-binding protein [Chloroflexota bacterium]